MERAHIRIADIAEELGLSTATVSNVIHGKTKKISDATAKRVWELVEKSGYFPDRAEILLAQNDSKIIGIVVNDHEKYEGHVLEDGFIAASVNALAKEIDAAGCFMMVKVTNRWDEIVRFASMWNMEGLVIIGFCEQDYKKLRDSMRIPFVVYDGDFEETERICNLTIDDYDGGRQVGNYFKRMGHKKVLCISDNLDYMDSQRMAGCAAALGEGGMGFLRIPMQEAERKCFYREREAEILAYTAVFAVSDFYAAELIRFLQERGHRIPDEISVVGFDDSPLCTCCSPPLTTVRQDTGARAKAAVGVLRNLREGTEERRTVKLPVSLVERGSVKRAEVD